MWAAKRALVDSAAVHLIMQHDEIPFPANLYELSARWIWSGRMRCSRAHCRRPRWLIKTNPNSSRRRSFTHTDIRVLLRQYRKICLIRAEVLCLFHRHFAVSGLTQ